MLQLLLRLFSRPPLPFRFGPQNSFTPFSAVANACPFTFNALDNLFSLFLPLLHDCHKPLQPRDLGRERSFLLGKFTLEILDTRELLCKLMRLCFVRRLHRFERALGGGVFLRQSVM